ncbi:MAG: amino acid adenylation domain-containing protein [Nitrospina sp.]|jgi:D-alanine--poly(phosphoribitol) ligase subunit 1|nr:amino acid adenylation domain-containing protein [Nitrospina sp.]
MQNLAIEYLQNSKNKFPDKTALVDDGQGITFNRLWDNSLALAYWINTEFHITNQPISVNLPKSIDAVIALLAIQLSGNIYVPLDIDTPAKRKEKILEVLGSDLMLELIEGKFSLSGKILSNSYENTVEIESSVLEKLSTRKPKDPLYIIFTSGTTGTPKGVTISNASVIDYIDWAVETYKVTEAEIIGNQAPLFFDNSVLDLYLTFAKGCTLHLFPRDVLRFPAEFGTYISNHKINFIFFVPSLLSNLVALEIFKDYDLACLKKILFAGESMPLNTLKLLRSGFPSALLSNLYGPTEITVDAIYWVCEGNIENLNEVPLGKPCDNHQVIFLDEEEKPVTTPDKIAEICISGPGVALGYWKDAATTRGVFISNPESGKQDETIYKTGDLGYQSSKDGLIYMTGRKDNQFKHYGYRIEAGEIENALNQFEFILQSCVLYDSQKKRIMAFYTAGKLESSPPFRNLLSGILPQYMIPHSFHQLDQFPTTQNGKVDHKILREKIMGPKNGIR